MERVLGRVVENIVIHSGPALMEDRGAGAIVRIVARLTICAEWSIHFRSLAGGCRRD